MLKTQAAATVNKGILESPDALLENAAQDIVGDDEHGPGGADPDIIHGLGKGLIRPRAAKPCQKACSQDQLRP